jgi:hypothetical protein
VIQLAIAVYPALPAGSGVLPADPLGCGAVEGRTMSALLFSVQVSEIIDSVTL